MKVQTQFFGSMEVDDMNIVRFPQGLLGFPQLQNFFLVECSDEPLFLWLQSADEPKIAFTVLESLFFHKDYQISLYPQDMTDLEIQSEKEVKALNIIAMDTQSENISVNLKAPLVLNLQKRVGKQVILTDGRYSVDHSIVKQLQFLRSHVSVSHDTEKTTTSNPNGDFVQSDLSALSKRVAPVIKKEALLTFDH